MGRSRDGCAASPIPLQGFCSSQAANSLAPVGYLLNSFTIMNTNTDRHQCAGRRVNQLTGQLALALVLTTPAQVLAQNYAVLDSFAYSPSALALCGSALYGSAESGAVNNGAGLLFRLNPNDGSDYEVVKYFDNVGGAQPGALVSSGTTLYGVTQNGGRSKAGTVFRISADGTGFALLRSFGGSDGQNPSSLVVLGTALYGAASAGGTSNYGTIFRLNRDGAGFQVLKQFTGLDGKWPRSLAASGTTLYGITSGGGISNYGTVFRLEADGSGFQVIKHFTGGLDGNGPNSLVLSGTTLYGTTRSGGSASGGNVFRLSVDGSGYTSLLSFNDVGTGYGSVSVLSNDVLYGAAELGGTVFQLKTDGTGYQAIATGVGGYGLPLVLAGSTLYGVGYYTVSNITHYDVFAVGLPSDAPTIFVAPQSQVVEVGGQVSFRVAASGESPLLYRWLGIGGEPIDSATNSVLQLTNIQPAQAGAYRVAVDNAHGSVTSSPAMLNVVAPGTVPVTLCSEVALRAALKGTNSVTFACDGSLLLRSTIDVNTDTILDGGGHQVIISGGNLVPLFNVARNTSLTLLNLTLASGVSAGRPGGGAVYNEGTVNATNCTFTGNSAWGSPPSSQDGSNGSNTRGGAIFSLGTLNLAQCSLLGNVAVGGNGQWGMPAPPFPGAPPDGGPGGNGGFGLGGAVGNAGTLTCLASLFASNSVVGGTGGTGGAGQSIPCVYPGNGGPGGGGGNGLGEGLYSTGSVVLVNCTFAGNYGSGGLGGFGGMGGFSSCHGLTGWGVNGSPGGIGSAHDGIYVGDGLCGMTNCTVAFNQGGGIQNSGGTLTLVSTLLASNTPGNNCTGSLIDLGYNLSSDASGAFTSVGSLNNTDPLLAPLANNGGPTLTMALLPGSPAIDAGDTVGPPSTDQRGFPRPAGAAGDIGAFEFGSMMPTLTISRDGGTGLSILGSGNPGSLCRLLASPDMSSWVPIATNQIGTDGTTLFYDTVIPGSVCRFYRLATP